MRITYETNEYFQLKIRSTNNYKRETKKKNIKCYIDLYSKYTLFIFIIFESFIFFYQTKDNVIEFLQMIYHSSIHITIATAADVRLNLEFSTIGISTAICNDHTHWPA